MKILSLLYTSFLSLFLLSCSSETPKKSLKIAATSIPHAEILEFIKPDLREQGIDLQIIVVEDYNVPNRALADKEVDANFFQHPAFLGLQIKDFGYPLEILGAVHLEPMGIYSRKFTDLNALPPSAKIALPSDPSNQARALELLEKAGLIELKRHDSHTSLLDITKNPRQIKFVEIDSPLLARALEDVDAAAITTNFALQGQIDPRQALAIEGSDSDYVNVIVIRKGEGARADLQALKQMLQSEKVRQYIDDKYNGAVIPAS